MKIRTLKIALVISLIFGFSALFNNAQVADKNPALEFNDNIPKVINYIGWEVPDVKRLEFVKTYSREMDGVIVETKVYDGKGDYSIKLDSYGLKKDKGLFISPVKNLQVGSVSTREVKGKIFSIGVLYSPRRTGSNGLTDYTGAVTNRIYVDEDGDGIFETMYQRPEDSTEPIMLPKWLSKK